MNDYNATINSKGCDKTGITEDLAAELFNGGRSTVLAIIELSVVKDHTNHVTGAKGVQLMIDTIEPVICENVDVESRAQNDVRRIMRALHMNRKMDEGQLPLDAEDKEPKLAEVLAAAEAHVETDENGEVTGLYEGEPDDQAVPDPEVDEQPDEPQAEDPENVVRHPAFSDA